MLLLLLLIGGGSYAWGETKTGTITFGAKGVRIEETNVTGSDNLKNSWSVAVVFVKKTYFANGDKDDFSQVGSSNNPATSITFTMTLPSDVKFTSFSAKFGGFKGTKGNISLAVDGATVGSGELNAKNDVTVDGKLETAATGKELKVSVTGIDKGVKCYNITYTYEDSSTPQPGEVAAPTLSLAEGTYWKTQTLTIGVPEGATGVQYTLDGTDPKESNTAELVTKATALELSATTTVKAVAVDNNDNYSKEVSRTYTFVPSIANTKETAYTTAQAIEIINKASAEQLAAENVYVKGVVSKVGSYNALYKSITYWLDDNAFQVYSGKGLDNKDFNSKDDIEIGANVIICGKIKKFDDNTYEFDKENYLVEYKAPVEKVLKSIAISGEATKTTYKEGEAFDPTGLVVTATYDDESTKVVTDDVTWTFDPATLILEATEVNVTATYGEKTASKTVAVTVTEVQKYNVTWNVNGKVYTEGAPTTEVVEGEKLSTLPTAPASIGGLVFMGWTNEAVTSQETAPVVLFTSAADAPAVTADVTYYAVFASQSGSMKWKKVSLANVDEGVYALITPDGHAFNGEIENGHGQATADAFVFDKDVATSAPEGTLEITLSAKDGGYTMFNADKGYLYAKAASSGNLEWQENDAAYWKRKSTNWVYALDKEVYLRSFVAKSGAKTFRTYANGNYDPISFVKKVSDISYSNYTTTVETNSLTLRAFDGKNYFATFSSDKAVKFVDATVFTVDVENGTISLNEIASKQVPANTGVLLRSAKESDVFTYIESAPAIEGTNLLKPASEQMTEGFKFYKLAYDNYTEKTGLGFYWGAENGGAYTVKPGLAYLAVPEAQAANVKGFSFDGTQTGINGVEATTAKGAIYNLNGQRVEKTQRGIYIQNGKKFIVK